MENRNSFTKILKIVVGILIVLSCSFAGFDSLTQKENLMEHDISLMGIEEQKSFLMIFQCMYAIALAITYPI